MPVAYQAAARLTLVIGLCSFSPRAVWLFCLSRWEAIRQNQSWKTFTGCSMRQGKKTSAPASDSFISLVLAFGYYFPSLRTEPSLARELQVTGEFRSYRRQRT